MLYLMQSLSIYAFNNEKIKVDEVSDISSCRCFYFVSLWFKD